MLRQYKPSFAITNAIRVAFFVLFTLVAVLWSFDLVGVIDPFKIYNPLMLGGVGIGFITVILVLSFFVYRPWCHFFCPFGLAGWLGEKISIFKVKVDYKTCIACEKCARACPSTVMDATLKRDRVIPDCFACGTCIHVCPVNAISFTAGKRPKPPEGKFK